MSSSEQTGLAIFASGSGSNALKIIEHFAGHPKIHVRVVITNNPRAGVLLHAHRHQIPSLVITKKHLADQRWMLTHLSALQVDRIVLAGFLLLLPEYLISLFPRRIVNIHPALLPKYGGKGMYGMHVHEAVKRAGDAETGITVHLVNEQYDDGEVLFQQKIPVDPSDSAETIAEKIHRLEHAHYPQVIAEWVTGNK
jgi:phosphoribosylglycinamide formyltransferase-1